jgi:hypothetical protein
MVAFLGRVSGTDSTCIRFVAADGRDLGSFTTLDADSTGTARGSLRWRLNWEWRWAERGFLPAADSLVILNRNPLVGTAVQRGRAALRFIAPSGKELWRHSLDPDVSRLYLDESHPLIVAFGPEEPSRVDEDGLRHHELWVFDAGGAQIAVVRGRGRTDIGPVLIDRSGRYLYYSPGETRAYDLAAGTPSPSPPLDPLRELAGSKDPELAGRAQILLQQIADRPLPRHQGP